MNPLFERFGKCRAGHLSDLAVLLLEFFLKRNRILEIVIRPSEIQDRCDAFKFLGRKPSLLKRTSEKLLSSPSQSRPQQRPRPVGRSVPVVCPAP
ncbi:MAG: hypothetical protein K1X78_26865 [Verrucomicrobiaceae bacterium]|nr:hypothetical protein [Verrucomicrobiaceae bacterium]